jgi:hypothetical protein
MRTSKQMGSIFAVIAATAAGAWMTAPRRRRRASPRGLPAEARTADGVLLFYNLLTGAVTTGRVDAAGNYGDLRNYTGFDRDWSHIAAANGLVLFHNNNKMVSARVDPDGTLQELKAFATPRDLHASHVVVTDQGFVLFVASVFTGQPGKYLMKLTTGQIDETGNLEVLRVHEGLDFWTHVVPTTGGLVLFYNSKTKNAATGRVDTEGRFQDLRSFTAFDAWTQIVSTSDGFPVFYNRETGALALGQIDANGNYSDLRFHAFQPGFLLAPTTNGRVMFYRAFFDPGRQANVGEAVFGRFDAVGGFSSGPLTPLDVWYSIVPVR